MQRVLKKIRREQQGSYVAQAAGIALFVTALVLAMLGMLDWLQVGLTDSLRCYIAGFDTGGCGGAGPAFDQHLAVQVMPWIERLAGA